MTQEASPVTVVTSRPPKDPKKVAAGRKGAEARKSKQEALLKQLRQAKEDTIGKPAAVPEESTPAPQTSTDVPLGDTPWLAIGLVGAAVVGVAVYLSQSPKAVSGPTKPAGRPVAQLNTRQDPFYMQ
jgi:ElaB/YqjD/DUF883 family membrane-anchored ribosome-binding protein